MSLRHKVLLPAFCFIIIIIIITSSSSNSSSNSSSSGGSSSSCCCIYTRQSPSGIFKVLRGEMIKLSVYL